jgi:short-subunit dehydrogenase
MLDSFGRREARRFAMTRAMQQHTPATRPLAAVTGASSGIGLELARCCADHGFDLLIAANEPGIQRAAQELRATGSNVEAVEVDLATRGGVDRFCSAARGRPIDALLANLGRGLGHAFLDQDFEAVRRVIDTNITGTLYLIQKIGCEMRARRDGRMLITGLVPGSYSAVCNGAKAFLDSFALALRDELKDSGITVTCLMPGVIDTELFGRAQMLDTNVGTARKGQPADVARVGFEAMMKGSSDAVTGLKNKLQAAAAASPSEVLAERHRRIARS